MEKKPEDREKPPSVRGGDDADDDGEGEEKAAVETGHRRSSSSSSSWLFVGAHHPCSLMPRIVRACAGCLLGLCQPGAAADAAAEAERGNKRDMASPQVLAARRPPRRPGGPREGRGGGGGSHN
ncbi:hypothetical protein BS78_07G061000 [Paspalum vaginatum]|nr:hypothetical protein BS78_07G061000 [Paspalum vaginatum]